MSYYNQPYLRYVNSCESCSIKDQQIQQLNPKVAQLEQSNNQRGTEITTKNQELSAKDQQINAKDQLIQQLNTTIAQLQQSTSFQQNQQLNTRVAQLEQSNNQRGTEITTKNQQIAAKDQQIQQLTSKVAQLEQSNNQRGTEITTKNQQITAKDLQIQQLTSKVAQLEQSNNQRATEISTKDQQITAKEEAYKKIVHKNDEYEEQKCNVEVLSETPPSLSIQMDSLLDLNQLQGWPIKSSEELQKIITKEMITVGIIGMYDVGKSWFCNEFTGKKLSTSGFNKRTDSLDCHFPTEDGNLIGIIDSPGSNEAIRVTQVDIVNKVKAAHDNSKSPKETSNKDEYMLNYKILKNDARILQDLKEKFIGEVSDVLILICNKLSEKEQESIYKVIKHHKKILKERVRSQEQAGSAIRDTRLYIIHNYKMLTEKEQVENQIKRDLTDSFDVKPVPLSNEEAEFNGCNNLMYQDQYGISHLILAAKGTNAGKYYNDSTFGFLKGKIKYIENRTSANVKQLFLKFCNEMIPTILKQEEIKLKFNPDESAIVKEDGPNVVLENLRYDEFGDFSLSTAFQPRCSVFQRHKDSNTIELIVDVELVDSLFEADYDRDQTDGYWYLFLKGRKTIPTTQTNNESDDTNISTPWNKDQLIKQDRERGQFEMKVPLLNLNEPKVTRYPPAEGQTKDGVVRWVFEFSNTGKKRI